MSNATLVGSKQTQSQKDESIMPNKRPEGINLVNILLTITPIGLIICGVFIFFMQQNLGLYKKMVLSSEQLISNLRVEQNKLYSQLKAKDLELEETQSALQTERQKPIDSGAQNKHGIAILEQWSVVSLISSLEASIEELNSSLKLAREPAPRIPEQKIQPIDTNHLRADILTVDIPNALVAIGVGSIDGAMRGMQYDVWYGSTLVIKLELDEIHETVSIAKAAPGYLDAEIAMVGEGMTLELDESGLH
ncbi:MAG: hypothetical protein ACI9CF_000577 [Candidatus Omnitrophota bacterium]|jgi:hypothetical protein